MFTNQHLGGSVVVTNPGNGQLSNVDAVRAYFSGTGKGTPGNVPDPASYWWAMRDLSAIPYISPELIAAAMAVNPQSVADAVAYYNANPPGGFVSSDPVPAPPSYAKTAPQMIAEFFTVNALTREGFVSDSSAYWRVVRELQASGFNISGADIEAVIHSPPGVADFWIRAYSRGNGVAVGSDVSNYWQEAYTWAANTGNPVSAFPYMIGPDQLWRALNGQVTTVSGPAAPVNVVTPQTPAAQAAANTPPTIQPAPTSAATSAPVASGAQPPSGGGGGANPYAIDNGDPLAASNPLNMIGESPVSAFGGASGGITTQHVLLGAAALLALFAVSK